MSTMEAALGRAKSAGNKEDAEHWIGVSDLMAGLMMVFLFIAIAFMRYVMVEQERVKDIVATYQENQQAIYEALIDEFETDLDKWGATINRESLEFQFKSPDVLFESGRSDLRPQFQTVLQSFYPRYIATISEFRDSIDEIRIEGHTSSDWAGVVDEEAYFRNMELSQGRTRAVLQYVNGLLASSEDQAWTRRHVAAVGYSSSRAVFDPFTRNEDQEASRRVNFRVITNAEAQIVQIIEGR